MWVYIKNTIVILCYFLTFLLYYISMNCENNYNSLEKKEGLV